MLEQAASEFDGVSASLAILVRFDLVRRRSEAGESDLASYELEARLLSLVTGPQFGPDNGDSGNSGMVPRAILAFSSLLVGTQDYQVPDRPWLVDLERAFLYERARRYRQAIYAYEEILVSHQLPRDTAAIVELHRAFCLAMTDDADAARFSVTTIMETVSDAEIDALGSEILRFLDFIDSQRSELAQSELANLDLARGLYFAMDYEGADAVLSEFVSRRSGDVREAEARFYLGRTREERGDSEGALREYFRVGLLDPSGTWAIESMRRVLVLASLYYSDEELAEASHRELVRLNDRQFTDAVDPYRELIEDLARVTSLSPPESNLSVEPVPPELFVRTEPPGATIRVDGTERGVSPTFIENLTAGPVEVEATLGDFRGDATVEVRDGEITSVVLSLGRRFGALDIRTTLRDVVVYLDETSSFSLGSPSLEQITPGQYLILIEGTRPDGQLVVLEREITIRPDQTTSLEFE